MSGGFPATSLREPSDFGQFGASLQSFESILAPASTSDNSKPLSIEADTATNESQDSSFFSYFCTGRQYAFDFRTCLWCDSVSVNHPTRD